MRYIKFIEDGILKDAWQVEDALYECKGHKFDNKIGKKLTTKIEDIDLKCPCTPSKVFAVALNYKGLIDRNNFTEPITFIKPKSAVIGPNENIINPFKDRKAWGEPELAVVLKKQLSSPESVEEVKECIWGYTIANDVTVQNVDNRDHHLVRSKGVKTFCPLGPWIDIKFEPTTQKIYGGQLQKERIGTLDQMFWNVEEALLNVSQWVDFEPGDVVIMGTPPFIDGEVYLQNGKVYTAVIEGLGELKNTFRNG